MNCGAGFGVGKRRRGYKDGLLPALSGFGALFKRELAMAWNRGGGPAVALAFNVGAVTLLPLASGGSLDKLKLLAPGFSWVALALASLLSLERLFERDYEDRALDLLALGPAPLELVAVAKCLAQWICTGIPLAVFAPVAATALGAWFKIAGKAHWESIHEVREDYPHADSVGSCVVFNIGGNKYRLITRIFYATDEFRDHAYVLHVWTHKEYDTNKWKSDCDCD